MQDRTLGDVSLDLSRQVFDLLDSLSALYALTEVPVEGVDEPELLRRALAALMENQDMERCSIFLVDDEGCLANAAGLDWDDLLADGVAEAAVTSGGRSPRRFPVGEGIMGRAAASGDLQSCGSCADDPRFKTVNGGATVHGALVCAPLRSQDGTLGVLNVFHPDPGFFGHWHERVLGLFGSQLGQLLLSRRLFRGMEQQVAERTAEVRRQQAFLRTVIDGVAEPIMVIDPDYRVRLMNRAAADQLPETMESRDGPRCYQVSHRRDTPCEAPEHECPLEAVGRTGETVTVVHQHYDADGEPRLVEVQGSPLWGEAGEVEAIVESARDITEQALAEAELRESRQRYQHLAHHDPLTGLANRLLFQTQLHHSVARTDNDHELGLLFIDLDGFKTVNDTLGHELGDRLLQVVARRIQSHVRDHDLVARLGGDEFTVILEGLDDADQAAAVARKLIETLSEPIHLDEHELLLSASIGISLFPDDSSDSEELVRCADTAMYYAKALGRGRFQFYTEELNSRMARQFTLEHDLRHALREGEFTLHYQPQVELAGGRVVGVEALLRWHHPEKGLLYPSAFLAEAGEAGLMEPLGEWVLHTACAQLAAWHAAGLEPGRMAVNLAPAQLNRGDFADQLAGILVEHGLGPEHLELDLEVPQGAIHEGDSLQLRVLEAVAAMGVGLNIDDFGTGHSSLLHLYRFPASRLKIDGRFIQGMETDRESRVVVETIIGLARNLGLRVVAEGVETVGQFDHLCRRGCDEAQGYLFCPPQGAATIDDLLHNTGSLLPSSDA